jgi:hypothetical protein
MASGITFLCSHCEYQVQSWDDGNPYYYVNGKKKYAYHPQHDLLKECIGNDSPHICLACSEEFMVDSLSPISACPKCESDQIIDTWELKGKQCPKCKEGKFVEGLRAIS